MQRLCKSLSLGLRLATRIRQRIVSPVSRCDSNSWDGFPAFSATHPIPECIVISIDGAVWPMPSQGSRCGGERCNA